MYILYALNNFITVYVLVACAQAECPSADMSTQYFSRSAKSLTLRHGPPDYEEVKTFSTPDTPVKNCKYSPDGSKFVLTKLGVTEVLSPDGPILAKLPIEPVDMYFSPKSTHLVTWNRPVKDQASGHWQPNLKIWKLVDDGSTLEAPIAQFVQKTQGSFRGGWQVQWTASEDYGVVQQGEKTLIVMDGSFTNNISKLAIPDGIAEFKVSHGKNPCVAVFVPSKNGKPAAVRVYRIPVLGQPVSFRTLFRAESVNLQWNNLGTALLVTAITDVDASGKSYYGESFLYLLNVATRSDMRIILKKEGPVHDVVWSDTSDQFGAVYGYMPAQTTFFNARGKELHTLPPSSRNTLRYSPQGRYIVVAGFGNLQGAMDILDREKNFATVASLTASNTTFYEWSPCGRYILTATLSPRLRVDNGVRLWHFSGKLLYHSETPDLYAVGWRPQIFKKIPEGPEAEAHESAATTSATKPAIAPRGAYRPPHARNTPSASTTPASSSTSTITNSSTAAKPKRKPNVR